MKGQDLIIGSEGCVQASIIIGQDIQCLPYAGFLNGLVYYKS